MAEFTRFYNNFQPQHYDIYLDIDRQNKQFNGQTTILGNATVPEIALHQKNLVITAVKVDGQTITYKIDSAQDALHLVLPKTGIVKIDIIYHATLTDTMMGIYPSYYDINGRKQQIIGTQFETNFARQAFPSIDEPEAKATFDLALKFDEQPGETVLANMPEKRVDNGVHYFDTTVRMSTYLVAFAFGELQHLETTTASGVKVGVYATKAHPVKNLNFALDIAKRSIEFFETFYHTPYPLPQSNQLALPDFSAGAMENWGLVTYREAYLLLDPDNTALPTKQVVATVIAHELAHQWFGDLVTMKWWDDLWLNESFANMMEYVAIDALAPDWHIWETFQSSDVPAALRRDATDGVQPVHVQVNHPDEIDALFDPAIVYAKGARMLVMVRALIGDEALRQGLKAYFAAHQYGNATGADLWRALGEASGQDVSAIMGSWLEQPGYPVITAEVIDGQLKLSQKQFFIGDGQSESRLWQVPLTSNYADIPTLLSEPSINVGDYQSLRQAAGVPFRLNIGNNAHVVVSYDETLLKDILAYDNQLDAISQLQLLQDWRLLSEANQMSYAKVVPLLKKFGNSRSDIVNNALYRLASGLKQFVAPDSDAEKNLKQLYHQLSQDQFERLGWAPTIPNEPVADQLTRPYILSAALYADNKVAIAQAHEIFMANQEDLMALTADTRAFVLLNEVTNYGKTQLIDQLLSHYVAATDASYKQDLRLALTSTQDHDMIRKIIKEFKNADVIKPQDLRGWFAGLLNNSRGEQLAWDWIRKEWSWLEATVGGDMEFTSFITVIANILKTPERLDEFNNFFTPKLSQPALTREITMDRRVIETRVTLVENEKKQVIDAIRDNI
ncbi:M1 family metallopeptidase [Leuconostoc citreum]|uniref:M1 family metallopeptidase n=1 Tax=Leuconostoc citreum TaxID=33964 RepID=UPI0005440FF8|nr:M1 family metallopeptidase [Leuconostoc citreum]MCJ2166866.1 M1 family metallopeptidase [Leuconostoc citreum]MCT3054279.1 M1 family peptidase [Leuconostoc citreum]MCT3057384.1 M1 family peptidase [Leuconostoc citreum]MCT3059193.1 M1 family peptidase [Leuconostoc citreum]MCT3059559.1 M1 family peptidase [Leuconostoc citreum]